MPRPTCRYREELQRVEMRVRVLTNERSDVLAERTLSVPLFVKCNRARQGNRARRSVIGWVVRVLASHESPQAGD
jgi:hypothetical protein